MHSADGKLVIICKPEEKYSACNSSKQVSVKRIPFIFVFKVVEAYTLKGFL